MHLVVSAPTPTRVYALSAAELAALGPDWTQRGGAFFKAGDLDQVLVLQSENEGPVAANRAVLAERAEAWLDSQGMARMPGWFKHGFAEIIASATFDQGLISVGQVVPEYAKAMSGVVWIPTSRLLMLPSDDPEFHTSPAVELLYDAECWWLAHVTLFDGLLDKYMPAFLALQERGMQREAAFAAAFRADFEALDSMLRKQRRSLVMRQYQNNLPSDPEPGTARAVDDLEMKARLAELLQWKDPQSARALAWAREVLGADAANERALTVLMAHQLEAGESGPLLQTLQRLDALPTRSPDTLRALAKAKTELAALRDQGNPDLAKHDPDKLRAQAREHLRQAMAQEPDNPLAPLALGWLLVTTGDVAGMREIVPAVEAAIKLRPYSLELVELMGRISTLTNNAPDQLKYAALELRLAATDAQRNSASQRVERLRGAAAPAPQAGQLPAPPPATPTAPPIRIPSAGARR
jgi:tetratricopeptide (TPR) repeat protein